MRSIGITAFYCWWTSSLAAIVVSIGGSLFLPWTGLGYLIWIKLILTLPMVPVHTFLIFTLQKVGYTSESITWILSALFWMTLWLCATQFREHDLLNFIPLLCFLGLVQTLGYWYGLSKTDSQKSKEFSPNTNSTTVKSIQ